MFSLQQLVVFQIDWIVIKFGGTLVVFGDVVVREDLRLDQLLGLGLGGECHWVWNYNMINLLYYNWYISYSINI
jgi:hypothetical protein